MTSSDVLLDESVAPGAQSAGPPSSDPAWVVGATDPGDRHDLHPPERRRLLPRLLPRAAVVALTALVGLLPAGAAKNRALRVLGHAVDPTAVVGPCLLLDVGVVRLGPHARIGTGTVVRSLHALDLGAHAGIGQWNWITAVPAYRAGGASDPRYGTLAVGVHSAVTSRHYLDCSGGITVGAFTTVAGVRSTVFTHGIDVATNTQVPHPVTIGDYCLVGSDAKLVPGASIPDGCLVAMGSVIKGALPLPRHLYAGNPATAKRPVDGDYFTRPQGYVTIGQDASTQS